jgi:hypothetical protein
MSVVIRNDNKLYAEAKQNAKVECHTVPCRQLTGKDRKGRI